LPAIAITEFFLCVRETTLEAKHSAVEIEHVWHYCLRRCDTMDR
jgi:hypothetical protein